MDFATLSNADRADFGEEVARAHLESELDATIVALGDSRLPRSQGRQDLDIVAIIDGELTAVEVKTRFAARRAGTLTSAGNLHRPRLRRVSASSKQGTQSYAADRMAQFLEIDGLIRTVVVVVDLRALLIQYFALEDGRITGPLGDPVDCSKAVEAAARELNISSHTERG